MAPRKVVRTGGASKSSVTYFDVLVRRSHEEDIRRLLQDENMHRRTIEDERDSLKQKISIIRDVLRSNDVDGARKCLDNMDSSLVYERQNTRDHSAGSLLDQSKVSEPEFEICGDSTRRTSALKARELIGKVLRSSRASKGSTCSRRSRSEPDGEFQDIAIAKSGEKRKSTDSSDSYFDIEMNTGLQSSPFYNKSDYKKTSVNICDSENAAVELEPRDGGLLRISRTPTVNRLNRPHKFVSRSLLRMESCDVCGRRVAFGKPALKCTECRLVIHSACSNRLTQVCVPSRTVATPQSSMHNDYRLRHTPGASPCPSQVMTPTAGFLSFSPFHAPASPTLPFRTVRNLNLADWCPLDQRPRVPALVIHCANEIRARGLQTTGVYRVSGTVKQINDLYDKFLRGKGTPGLARIEDIHVVSSCLKLFLRNLSEPLVTYRLRPLLQTASDHFSTNPDAAMVSVINTLAELPTPNRDTLAFIMLHLKEVARSTPCQMNEDNLSKMFGPTLIGYSCPEPQVMQTLIETKVQHAVMKLLFNVPDEIYSKILWCDAVEEQTNCQVSPRPYFTPLIQNYSVCKSNVQWPVGVGASVRRRVAPNSTSSPDDNSLMNGM